MDSTRKRLFGAAAICAAAVLVIVSLLTAGVIGSSPANADDDSNNGNNACATAPRFIAYNAPQGSNQFGPNQNYHDWDRVSKRYNYKLCVDPLWTATIASFIHDGANVDAKVAEDLGKQYSSNHNAWALGVLSIKNSVLPGKAGYSIEYDPNDYDTFGMVIGENRTVQPSLIKVHENRAIGYVLVLHLKDGKTTLKLRIFCDFQPGATSLPNVPTKPAAPKGSIPSQRCCDIVPPNNPSTPGNPTTPPTCQGNSCNPTTPPTHTPTCQETGTCPTPKPSCVCTDKTKVQIDPRENNPDVPQGTTPGSSTAPQPLPQAPVPAAGSAAPHPNNGGYDSGAKDGSGTSGGTITNPDGSVTGGGPAPARGPVNNTDGGTNNGTDGTVSTGGGTIANPF